jgi:hypothetical protein
MGPLPPAGSTSGANQRNGVSLSWSPNLLIPAGFIVLIAAFAIYLAQPDKSVAPPPIDSTQALSSEPASGPTMPPKYADKAMAPKNAIGSSSLTRHAVYGTSGANSPVLPDFTSRMVHTSRVDTPSTLPSAASKPFTVTNHMGVVGESSDSMSADSAADCEQKCAKSSSTCSLFAFNKEMGQCFLYSSGELREDPAFDSGVRTMRGIHVERLNR